MPKFPDIKDGFHIIQGGMGAAISLPALSGAVAREGGVGTITSVALDRGISDLIGRPVGHYEAAKLAVEFANEIGKNNGPIAINCMAHMHTCAESIQGAIDGGARLIIIGAGIYKFIGAFKGHERVAFFAVVSSLRAAKTIYKLWSAQGHPPDGFIVEGPLAGGHLGFSMEEIFNPAYSLENIAPPIIQFGMEAGIPVFVAGGVWNKFDIDLWLSKGAAGVQIGTRFLATEESSASDTTKQACVRATAEDIIIATNPGSPAGMAFRILKNSPLYLHACKRQLDVICELGYMLRSDGTCIAQTDPDYFCICEGLLSSSAAIPEVAGRELHTVGANAARVDRILSVHELMEELTTGIITP
ncbi:MAG: nitronate monooxygenase [bacterium]